IGARSSKVRSKVPRRRWESSRPRRPAAPVMRSRRFIGLQIAMVVQFIVADSRYTLSAIVARIETSGASANPGRWRSLHPPAPGFRHSASQTRVNALEAPTPGYGIGPRVGGRLRRLGEPARAGLVQQADLE